MLLGFYEIMTADHMKWNMHLAGAKQLFVETDFVGMMQQFRQMRVNAAAKDRMGGRRPSVPHCHVSPRIACDRYLTSTSGLSATSLGRRSGMDIKAMS